MAAPTAAKRFVQKMDGRDNMGIPNTNDKTPTACPLCPKISKGLFGLQMHMVHIHKRRLDGNGTLLPEVSAEPASVKGARPGSNGTLGGFFKDGVYSCPDCRKVFKYPTGFGKHRQTAHGISGSSNSALAVRQSASENPKPKFKDGFFHCPECKFKHTKAVVIGTHRRSKHGIAGKSAGTVPAKRQLTLTNGGKTPHENGLAIQTHDDDSQVAYDPVPYAIAVGSVKEFCRNFAEEHGLVTRVFTRQFAELFLRSARR